MSKLLKKILVAFDFDHTIVNDNIDTFIYKLAPNKQIPPELKALYRKNGWTEYMREIFKLLHRNEVTKDQILSCIEEIELTGGMEELIKTLPPDQTEIIIISDSNTVFINHMLERKGLDKNISAIFTNYAAFGSNGCLTLEMYHKQDKCDLSTINLCKGDILSKFVASRAANGVQFAKIAYVGDGVNDFCPSLRLSACDVVFPRLNYTLMKTITAMEEKRNLKIVAQVVPWSSGKEILNILNPFYNDLGNLTIPTPRLLNPLTATDK